MHLVQARMSSHPSDPEAMMDHSGFGGHLPHTHTIKEAWSAKDKSALGDHIDRYHEPVDHVLRSDAPAV